MLVLRVTEGDRLVAAQDVAPDDAARVRILAAALASTGQRPVLRGAARACSGDDLPYILGSSEVTWQPSWTRTGSETEMHAAAHGKTRVNIRRRPAPSETVLPLLPIAERESGIVGVRPGPEMRRAVSVAVAPHALAQRRIHTKAVQMILLLFLWQVRGTHGSVRRQVPNHPTQAPVSAPTL